jgi:glycosyltransferase
MISIITVTYNSEQTLQKTIDSVLTQSYPNIEYIIIDGNSTDNTLNIIKENEPKFAGRMKWISEPDNGIYEAMNKGIKLTSGDIIGILNSDDAFFSPEIIAEVVNGFQITKCDVLYGDLIYQKDKQYLRYWKSNPFRYRGLYFGWMPPHPTLYCRKEIYEKNGSFDLQFRISADYDFILRIFKNKNYHFAYLRKVLVLMNTGGISNGSFRNIMAKSKEDYIALKKNGLHFGLLIIFFKNSRKIVQFLRGKIATKKSSS